MTACPLPRAISHRLTAHAGPNAIANPSAMLHQNFASPSPAAECARNDQDEAVVDGLHDRDRHSLRRDRHARRLPQGETRAQHRPYRQGVAEEKRENDRHHDRGEISPPRRGRERHSDHLADRAAGEAVRRRRKSGPVQIQVQRVRAKR